MNLKIYILKKKQIIWSAIILATIIIAIIVFLSYRAAQTMDILSLPNSYKADINNDGKVDSIVVKTDSPTKDYCVNVICSDENGYELQPDNVIKTLGKINEKTPINITFKDIDNDKSDEIFIQSSDKKGPILHVFKYNNNNIQRVASGRYFMYGHFLNPNEKSNILVLASRYENSIHYSYLKSEQGQLVPYFADSSLNLGVKKLSSIVKIIEDESVKAVNLSFDKKLDSVLTKGTLLDGIISNVEIADYDTPTKCTYTIRTTSEKSANSKLRNYQIQLSMNNADAANPDYSISDIKEIK